MTDTNFLRSSLRAAGVEQVSTCKLCGAIVNDAYQDVHNRIHQGDYEPFALATPVDAVDTCKLCGILVNRSYTEAHSRSHA